MKIKEIIVEAPPITSKLSNLASTGLKKAGNYLGNYWNNNMSSTGKQINQTRAMADTARQETIKTYLQKWISATAGVDPNDVDSYQSYFKDWVHKDFTLRSADENTIENAAEKINPSNAQSITQAITDVLNNAMLARATQKDPNGFNRQTAAAMARKGVIQNLTQRQQPQELSVAQVTLPIHGVISKGTDGIWKDQQGDKIVNQREIEELERLAQFQRINASMNTPSGAPNMTGRI